MLTKEKQQALYDFVRQEPRTVQEIAGLLAVSWLTAERYIQKIAADEGLIATKTFRGGTKGALKIVYWNSLQLSTTALQQRLETQISTGRFKQDWSAAELYHHTNDHEKRARMIARKDYTAYTTGDNYRNLLLQANEQVLFFSGNLSFLNIPTSKGTIYDTLVELGNRGVRMKVLTRVSIVDNTDIERLEAINLQAGQEVIEIRHEFQPARATIIDDKIISIKEIYDHTMFAPQELKEEVIVFYEVYDKQWIMWMTRVFWKLYQSAISSRNLLKGLRHIKDAEKYLRLT